ncbi:hypothetical protein AcW1_005492 [Taiwanofungus camphoratus]|nr:hypothetical protein AcW1_005492 [Antrodia cinnamomea]
MSYNRQYLSPDASPLRTSPPASPWRARAEVLRRRPLHFKQTAFIVAILVLCSILFFARFGREDSLGSITDNHFSPLSANALLHAFSIAPSSTSHPPQPTYIQYVDTPTDKAPEAVVFSLIMFSEDSASEGAVLMKSILMYTSSPIEFHIICDKAAQDYLEKRLRLISRPSHNIFVRFYLLSWSNMLGRLEREGAIVTDHSAGVPGLMKLFIHEILPDSVPRAIFIDTDAFFITDPTLLWDHFSRLRPTTAIAMPTHPEQSEAEWHHANRICSCIMLLDLARLRALRLMDSAAYRSDASGRFPPALAPPAFAAMFGAPGPGGHYEGVKLGDQGYWWAIVSHRPDIFEHLSYSWEVSSCLMDMYLTSLGDDAATELDELSVQVHTLDTPHEGEAILPKMLHFNCLDGTPRYYEWEGWSDPTQTLGRRWYPAVQYHVGFKWLWLNAHRPLPAKLTIETVENVVFADERFAMEQNSA